MATKMTQTEYDAHMQQLEDEVRKAHGAYLEARKRMDHAYGMETDDFATHMAFREVNVRYERACRDLQTWKVNRLRLVVDADRATET